MRITHARSATKHGIAKARSRFVVEHATLWFDLGQHREGEDPRLLCAGDDPNGSALEVIVVVSGAETFVVIHAMEMREKYRAIYELSDEWERERG